MGNLLKLVSFLFRSTEQLGLPRWLVVVLVGSGMVAGLASTALLAVINAALGRMPDGGGSLGWLFIALCGLLPLARFLSQYLLLRLSQAISFELRMRLSRKILEAPIRQLETLGAPRLLATLTDDIGNITGALTYVPALFLHIAVVASCLGYMGWLSWRLLFFVLLVVGLGVASYQIPLHRAFGHFRETRAGWDRLMGHFRGLTEGTKELKVHAGRREAFLDRELRPTAEDLRRHQLAGGMVYALANSWGQVLFFILIGTILFVLPETFGLASRVLTGYTLAILYMLTPLDMILNQVPNMGRAVVAVEAVERLGLSLEHESSTGTTEAVARPARWSELELQGVTHSFRREDTDDVFTLGPLDLVLRPGELIFVIGGNGSGKTTLAKLLIGLYTPESGVIRLGERVVTEDIVELQRQAFSVVFSDFFLFETLLGLEGPELDRQAKDFLRRLHLDRKVRIQEGSLSTLDLSQGQRKRLALLTAYMEDRPIYLFDEWAADQDPDFKEIFYLELLPELRERGKTVVVISHDDRYYRVADRIVKLDSGQVVFDGTVNEYLQDLAQARLGSVAGGEPVNTPRAAGGAHSGHRDG